MGVFAGPDVSESGLVLALDAANTKSYPGSETTWTDLSGSGNNGTLVNGVGYSSDSGGALVFDGVDDFVETPLDGPTSFLPTSNFSMSSWIRFDGFPNISNASGTICGSFNFDGYGLLWDGTTTGLWVGCQMRARDSNTIVNIRQPVNNNTWYFVTMSYSSSQNFMQLYVDDILVQSASSITGSYSSNMDNRNISINRNWVSRGGNTGRYFPGNIAQVSIYNRALTASEIQQNFNALKSRFIT